MNDRIHSITSAFPSEIQSIRTMDDCLQLKSKYLNKTTGLISLILKKLPELSVDERKQIGGTANQLKRNIEDQLKQKEKELENLKEKARFRALDITQPGTYHQAAPIHIIHQVIDECIEIFESIGFVSAGGPDVELDYYNFTALNFPPDHPAMEMHDTFYVADHHLLRTHTSP
ncbi:MAG: phenylalanine--tRNA ligase subunit alpha, partial [Candidatus Delongbacteria bacterium]|nr:phenylalanine--tRNA ligase subunit alpha [Candidatus Delongbacteria bacterium]